MSDGTANQFANVVSILSPHEVQQLGGLPTEAVVGILVDQSDTPAAFQPNPRFLKFLHQFLAVTAVHDPGLIAAARSQHTGWVYVIDARTPDGPQGRVPPEDIIGAFKVAEGTVVEGSYQPNDGYRGFTRDGITQLSASLREKLLEALRDVVQRRRTLASAQ